MTIGGRAIASARRNFPREGDMKKHLALALPLTLILLGPVKSDDVPYLNVNPVCKGIAEQSGTVGEKGGPDLTFKDCVSSEQEVKSQLAKQWSTFNAEDKGHCVRETQMGGESSYTELITCLEMARDVRAMHSQSNSSGEVKRND
jgi:hypothetical protein